MKTCIGSQSYVINGTKTIVTLAGRGYNEMVSKCRFCYQVVRLVPKQGATLFFDEHDKE
jgi:hypothetical protein